MRIPRVYTLQSLTTGGRVVLEGDAAIHLTRVLRLREGAQVIVFNGEGGEFEARIGRIERRTVEVDVGTHREIEAESALKFTLVQAISRGERMDFTLQKAVELGVTRIVPVSSIRSVVNLEDDRRARRHEHWMKIIQGACEQCGRNRIPELCAFRSLETMLREPLEGTGLVLDPNGEAHLGSLARAPVVTLLVGPEGGLDTEELALARKAGYLGLRLGPRVLRTETAALVALAALQAQWGDLA